MTRNEIVDSQLEQLRSLGEFLVPYNFPLAPKGDENDLSVLKKTELEIDGYTVVVHFNKSFYDDYYLETFQIIGKNSPFLPFSLVVKLACRVLGKHYLSFVEFYEQNRKNYCWSVCLDLDGRAIPSPIEEESFSCEYEGFEYFYLNPNQLNFY